MIVYWIRNIIRLWCTLHKHFIQRNALGWCLLTLIYTNEDNIYYIPLQYYVLYTHTHTHTPTYYTQFDDLFRFRRPQNVLFIILQTPESLNKNNISLVRYVYCVYIHITHTIYIYGYRIRRVYTIMSAVPPSSQR